MKSIIRTFTLCAFFAAVPAMAQDSHSGHAATGDLALTAGEVTRVDARGGKLTIRHEDIKNLDMPGMTMVFSLKNGAQAANFKPGDKVLFRVEDSSLTITEIKSAQ